jgi:hypothetical protein
MAKKTAELDKLRQSLLAKLTSIHLRWVEVQIQGGKKIEVSLPVIVDNFYVPVTAEETRKLANKFGALPLTRAVADQYHNQAIHIQPKFQDPSKQIFDFELYSTYLLQKYGDGVSRQKFAGAHKLWLLSSSNRIATNYGFYVPSHSKQTQSGKYLDSSFTVIQSLGGRHNNQHWDYSQLLQLMRGENLKESIVNGEAGFWDESRKMKAEDLP